MLLKSFSQDGKASTSSPAASDSCPAEGPHGWLFCSPCSIKGKFGKASQPVMRMGRGQECKHPHSWCHQPTISWLWSPPRPGKFNDTLWCIFDRWWSPRQLYGVSCAALGVQRFHSRQKTSWLHPLMMGSRPSWASKLLRKVTRNTAEERSAPLPQEPRTKNLRQEHCNKKKNQR